MNKNIEDIFSVHWEELKDNLKSRWRKFKAEDIDAIDGSYQAFIEKILNSADVNLHCSKE